jgi:2-hydroxychromene-2-carboxylate isomerase
MTDIDFFFDPISPYAYLAFEHLPQALEGCSYVVHYRPILFAGLLNHWGQKGPAEIEPKRAWTWRQVAWTARQLGIPLDGPAVHPFNPLSLLRFALACAPAGGLPNRRVVEAVFRHVWRGGADPTDTARVHTLAETLAPLRDPQGEDVKLELRQATDDAKAIGVFGVPTMRVGERLFWGVDALPMLRACLQGDPWFDPDHWQALAKPTPGVSRVR